MPAHITTGSGQTQLDPSFEFVWVTPANDSSVAADIAATTIARYNDYLFGIPPPDANNRVVAAGTTLLGLTINATSTDDTLQLGTDESYVLTVGAGGGWASLTCVTVYGCVHGMETFSQLVVTPPTTPGVQYVTGTPVTIRDAPRFPHRGLLIDTSRHYLPVPAILNIVDGLSFDKASVLHWHLTDAESFPYASVAVPELAAGAWAPPAIYTLDDIAGVVAYARYRAIAVVVEVDTPSHVQSWGVGRPDIVVNDSAAPVWTQLNPTLNATYQVYGDLIGELRSVLLDDRFHLGTDEVQLPVYNTTAINAWMAAAGMAAGDYAALVRHHMAQTQAAVLGAGFTSPLWWQEAFDHYGPGSATPTPVPAMMSPSSVAYLWYCPCWNWYNMYNITAMGFRGVKTDGWYLDNLDNLWDAMYTVDPLTDAVACNYSTGWANCTCPQGGCYFNITDPAAAARVLGGEGCAWGELMDATMIEGRVWPRQSAIGERLWSPVTVYDPVAALPRLVDHRCRMVARGMQVEPLQPDYCDGSRR